MKTCQFCAISSPYYCDEEIKGFFIKRYFLRLFKCIRCEMSKNRKEFVDINKTFVPGRYKRIITRK